MSATFRPGRSQQLGHGEHRADAHLVGLAAGHREAAEDAQRLQAALLGAACAFITTQADAPSENWLALPAVMTPPGIAGRILLTRLRGGVGADAFVGSDRDFACVRDAAGGLVGDAHRRWSSATISSSKLAGGLRRGGALLAAHAVFVLRLAAMS